jgi:hypothetical protein
VDFSKLSKKAKQLIDRRGGAGTLKADAAELKDIAQGEGTLSDKAKAAAQAIKEPGAHHETPTTARDLAGSEAPAGREKPPSFDEPPRFEEPASTEGPAGADKPAGADEPAESEER